VLATALARTPDVPMPTAFGFVGHSSGSAAT
jgi:hypothetical protein